MNAYADLKTLKSDAYLSITATTEDVYLRKLLEYASREIDKYTGRHFYCREEALYFDGARSPLRPSKDILSISTFKTDENEDRVFENTYTEGRDYNLYPLNDYPKTQIRVMATSSYGGFASGLDRAIEIDGVFGYGDGKSAMPYSDSRDALGAAIIATATTATVSSGGNFAIGQTVRINNEQSYIEDIVTNVLTFKRGVNGPTAVAHATAATISIYKYPQPIVQACLIIAMRAYKRKDSAYQDVVGGGPLGTVVTSKGIDPDVAVTINQYKKWRI